MVLISIPNDADNLYVTNIGLIFVHIKINSNEPFSYRCTNICVGVNNNLSAGDIYLPFLQEGKTRFLNSSGEIVTILGNDYKEYCFKEMLLK